MARIRVTLVKEDGEVLDTFVVVESVGPSDGPSDELVTARDIRETIEMKFEVED